jgi:hypothetical protein
MGAGNGDILIIRFGTNKFHKIKENVSISKDDIEALISMVNCIGAMLTEIGFRKSTGYEFSPRHREVVYKNRATKIN